MKLIAKVLAVAALAGIGATTLVSDVLADQRLRCRMKGTWVKSGGNNDDFEFDADYIAKDGPDTFTGRYENPGEAVADITGAATSGTWVIMLTYTDAKHKGMQKQLIGKGSKDSKTHLLQVTGTYKTLIGGNDIKADGAFKLLGNCK